MSGRKQTVMHPVGAAALALLFVTAGCATTDLSGARSAYYRGDYQSAASRLADEKFSGKDRVLFKMERGMMRQAAGDFEGSNRDFISAHDDIALMTAIQLAQDTGSMIINDNVQDYRGAPFERTLLHAFTAKNHLMLQHPENAAVEARRIIESLKPEVKKDYPEDAYSRYMAGLCLGLMGDWSNAGLQYRLAQQLAPHLAIDERTGFIRNAGEEPAGGAYTHELVVFVLTGRSPSGSELYHHRRPFSPGGYAEILIDGKVAGRSYELADTAELAFKTKELDALAEAAKTAARIAAKEVAAYQIDQQNEALGALFRIIMIGLLEQPDIRRWESLPRSLQVARMPCPANPKEVSVQFRGGMARSFPLTLPLPRCGNTYIAVVRDASLVGMAR